MTDHHAQVVAVADVARPPDVAQQLLLRHHASEVLAKQGEHRILLGRQGDFAALHADPSIGQVDVQPATDDVRRQRFAYLPLAQQHAHTGQELLNTEGLAHVVVGAAVQRQHLLALAGAHRQHQHRHLAPFTQAAQDLLAVEIGQTKVEHHHIRALQGRLGQTVFAVRGLQHPIALSTEGDAQKLANLRLIVDQQNARSLAHHSSSVACGCAVNGRCRVRLAPRPSSPSPTLTRPPWAPTMP